MIRAAARRPGAAALAAALATATALGCLQLPAAAVTPAGGTALLPAAAPAKPTIAGLVKPLRGHAAIADPVPGVLRSQRIALDPEVLPDTPAEAADGVELPLFADTAVVAQLEPPTLEPAGYQVWNGELAGSEGSSVVLVEQQGSVSGWVSDPDGGSYRLRPAPDGTAVIEQIDFSAYPEAHEHPTAPEGLTASGEHDHSAHDHSGDPGISASALEPVVVDVLVGYTTAAKDAKGGQAPMESDVALAVEQTNQAFATSGVNVSLRLVHAAEVATNGNADGTTIARLQAPGDGHYDDLMVLRDTYGADLVALIVKDTLGQACGLAYLMSSDSAGFASHAVSVTDVGCSTGNLTFAHELGHNFGAAHDRGAWAGSPAYPYGYDWVNSAAGWRTVMAYTNACAGCSRLLRFSNPDLLVGGAPTGAPIGAGNQADNRALLNTTASTVASFRGAPVPASLSVTRPAAGAQVAAPSRTAITWAASGNIGGAVKVELLRGSTVQTTLAAAAPSGTGSLAWAPAATLARGDDYRVRVTSVANPTVLAVSEPFSVVDPAITVTSQATAGTLTAGVPTTVTWAYTGAPTGGVLLELVREERAVAVLSSRAPLGANGSGSFAFTLPATLGTFDDYRVRATLTGSPTSTDTNDADQSHTGVGTVHLTSPDTGGDWTAGTSGTVTWTSSGAVGDFVKVELVKGRDKKGGAVAAVLAAKVPRATGTLTWTSPAKLASGADYRVRVTALANPKVFDSSDTPLTVAGTSVTLAPPADGAWVAGIPQTIAWERVGVPGTSVKLELVRPVGTPVVISSGAPLDGGSVSWAPPFTVPRASGYRIRATVVGNTLVTSTAGDVTVEHPGIAVASPTTSTTWTAGTPVDIGWQFTDGVAKPVDVQLVRGTRTVTVASKVATGAGGAGAVRWTPPLSLPPGADYRIRVKASGSTTVLSTSDALHALRLPTISATAPDAGATWTRGTAVTLGWQLSDGVSAPVRAQLVQGTRVLATVVASGVTAPGGAGSATWPVPATLLPGSYALRLRPVATATNAGIETTVAVTVA